MMLTRIRNKTQDLIKLSISASLALGLMACEQKKNDKKFEASGEQLFSNRPVGFQNFFAVVKLKNSPLFSSSISKNGKTVVDVALLKAIDEEQNEFLAQVAKISSNIKIIYKYRFVLNGFALVGPAADLEKLKALGQIASLETDGGFDRPKVFETQINTSTTGDSLKDRNSVKFIGAETLHARKILNQSGQSVALNGTGMKVGIIDTGIDYTHSMLGGVGSEALYKSIDPSVPNEAFPNTKVKGGVDLVGTEFNSASLNFSQHIPKPDANPLDEGGHGSHVAGSVAGLGDGVTSYNGVASGADLYAIKVFGAKGSTSDSVVIAGLEYAADPNGDGSPDDQLDVVNLSLGSSFGSAKILYNEAIGNLSHGGTVVVASAGNEGNVDYITGAPAVSDEAISVAASVDDTAHNWQNAAVRFVLPKTGAQLAEAVEAAITKKIVEAGAVQGHLVFAGKADQDFTPELAAQIKGQVALIDRGIVPFAEKIKRAAQSGAVGVVVVNNQPGNAFAMGGEGHFDIPAIMITQVLGQQIKDEMTAGEVQIQFLTTEKIFHEERIDTITDFSSKGPRSEDALIKPEISSPGSEIISAEMGGGAKIVKMSGTSMAGPHIAGAMALLKQAHPLLSSRELKSLLMNQAKAISDEEKNLYPISRQGAGRVRIDRSVDAKLATEPAALSLGEVTIESTKAIRKNVKIKNIGTSLIQLQAKLVLRGEGLKLRNAPSLTLAAGEEKSVALSFVLDSSSMKEVVREMDGWVVLEESGQEIARLPVLAVARKISNIAASDLIVESSQVDSAGSEASLKLTNSGKNAGDVLLFNLLAEDKRKASSVQDQFVSKACDLQSVGYRIIEKDIDGRKAKVLQIAAKVYEPLTQWNMCELSVLIDANGDQNPEQELAAISLGNVPGLSTSQNERSFASALFDANLLKDLRSKAEQDARTSGKTEKEDYSSAVLGLLPLKQLDHTTVMIVETEVSLLAQRPTGEIGIKVATQEFTGASVEADDFLAGTLENWLPLSLKESAQSFVNLPEVVTVTAGSTETAQFEKGYGQSSLLVLMPHNLTVFSDLLLDQQQAILAPKFLAP